jgi:hypothetical protein
MRKVRYAANLIVRANYWKWPVSAHSGNGTGRLSHFSVCSANSRASSTSIPTQRTVLSSLA